MMSALASTPSTPGDASAISSASQRAPPIGHRERLARDAEHAACAVVGCHDEQPTVRQQWSPVSGAQYLEGARRIGDAGLDEFDPSVIGQVHGVPLSTPGSGAQWQPPLRLERSNS